MQIVHLLVVTLAIARTPSDGMWVQVGQVVDESSRARLVDAIMSSGRLPDEIEAGASKKLLRMLIEDVDRATFLKPQTERGLENGSAALNALINLHGTLPDGAPPGLLHFMLYQWDGTTRDPSQPGLTQGAALDVIAADGPVHAVRRLKELPSNFADAYATDLAGWVGSRILPAPLQQSRRPISGWDDEGELREVLEAIGDWGVDRCEDFARIEDLPRKYEGSIVGVVGALGLIAAMAEPTPVLRVEAARSMNRIYQALDRATTRLESKQPIRAYGFLPSMLSLAAISNAPAGTGLEPDAIDAIVQSMPKVAQLSDERIDERILAAIISALESSSADICRFASAPDLPERPVAPNFKQRCTELAEGCVALIERISRIPSDHAAWTPRNRLAWAGACVRAIDPTRNESCEPISKAWAAADAALPAGWVAEAKLAAEKREATLEERRKARESQRAAWRKQWDERWPAPTKASPAAQDASP